MNRIDYQAQYLGNIRDQESKSSEDRSKTVAFHRLHARHGFDLPGQNPRRRHEMEDQGYIR